MATKFPMTGNEVTAPRRPARGGRARRGVALVSVISVLVLLMIVATPFLLSMRDSARRGETYMTSVRVEAEAESLFEQTRAYLIAGLEHVERRRLDQAGPGGGAQGSQRPPDDATPTSDTLAELQPPAEMVRQFNQLTGHEHRVWDVEVTDAQAKFNLNSCSVGVLANLLGRAELSDDIQDSDDRIPVSDIGAFPPTDGVVRIGGEVIKYAKADLPSKTLLGCQRGYKADKPENGGPSQHAKGDLVVHEAAFQLATRPFRAREDSWTHYTNLYEARAISELGVAALLPDEFDRMRRHLTAWSGNVVGDGWSNPQLVRNNVTAGDQEDRTLTIKGIRYFGPGTIVRITDGVNQDHAVVAGVKGSNQVVIVGDIRHDYLADQARVYSLARAPINVNTADAETLALVFDGLGLDGKSSRISSKQAEQLAVHLKKWVRASDAAEKNPEVGVFRSWEDWTRGLETARDAGILNQDDFEAVLRNSLNACDARLAFSTVPVCFRSFDVYEARATAVILGLQGQELARREMTRVFEVSSGRSSTFVLETQAEFQEQVRISRDAKWFVSYPVNVNAYYDAGNEPASEYQAYANKSRFPDTDRAPGAGHLQLRNGAFRVGQNDRYFHFDEQDIPDGLDLEKQALDLSVDGEYSTDQRKIDLRRFVDVPQRNESTELGLAPFACSFWYQPKWNLDNAEHVVFDYGLDEALMNRVSLRYDPQRRALVLAVADATREQRACEVEYVFADNQVLWDTEQWYHIACTVYGCSPEMMELFVDAERVGRTPLLTRLSNQIQATGDLFSVDVEDASGFPDSGVLLLRGPDGSELIEYSQKSDNQFQVSRRKARNIDKVLDVNAEVRRSHVAGEVVQLYGYAAPLLTDARRGGATLAHNLGPWRVFRARGTDTAAGSVGQPPVSITFNNVIACPPASAGSSGVEIHLTEWVTGNVADNAVFDDLGPQGTEGIAALVSMPLGAPSVNGQTPQSFQVTQATGGGSPYTADPTQGGVNIVRYRVDQVDGEGLKVILLEHGLALRHWDSSVWMFPAGTGGRFIPSHDYGDPASQWQVSINNQQLAYRGIHTAFVPIGVVAQGGSSGDYLDPVDGEPQLHMGGTAGSSLPSSAYVQIDSEWVKYDTVDEFVLPGKLVFYRDCDTTPTGSNDNGLPGLASLFFFSSSDITGAVKAPVLAATGSGGGGGQGRAGSNTEPPHVTTDGNFEGTAPPAPATGQTVPNLQPPDATFSMDRIAARTNFRSWEDRSTNEIRRVANTIARDHQSGTAVIPCFAVLGLDELDGTAAARGACPGFDDLITLRDSRGSDEQIRVRWGYMTPVPAGPNVRLTQWAAWIGPDQVPQQLWNWDRPQEHMDIARYPTQAWTRVLKFPSREMPDGLLTANQQFLRFGKKFDDSGGTTPAIVDELAFLQLEFPADADKRDFAFLGPVPEVLYAAPSQTGTSTGATSQEVQFVGIDDKSDEIRVFMPYWDPSTRLFSVQGLPIAAEVYRADGGMIRIDDELIQYATFDAGQGVFSGCLRGVCYTKAVAHDYGAIVTPVETYAISRLNGDLDATSASFDLVDAADFPQDGYLRIQDSLEILGYTEKNGNRLSGPLGRIDRESTDPDAGKQTGGALFRGRFGTSATGYAADSIVMAMPFRHYDRYAQRSDDPENSYSQFSWTKEGAIWKRITWDERPVSNVEVLALVRFSGGPAWDSDRIVKVGQQEIPRDDRRGWLYEITDQKAENLLNVEADRIEVRLMVRFDRGCYDRDATPRPNEWKQTPWIQRVLVEYVAPSSVLSQE